MCAWGFVCLFVSLFVSLLCMEVWKYVYVCRYSGIVYW